MITPSTPVHATAPSRSQVPPGSRGRLVTDAPTRAFHALFALSFVGAYLTAESEYWRLLHVTLGYTFAGLLLFRLLYGLVGPRQVRLSVLWRKVTGALQWPRTLWTTRGLQASVWKQAPQAGMALTIGLILLLVCPLALTGHATYNDWGDWIGGEWLEELHELAANTTLALVLAHMGLIALLSLIRRQNQAMPMITGRLPGNGPSPVKHNHLWLAILVVLGVCAFWGWQLFSGQPLG
ncbi:cytochrome b/b6 domain-containing protein [Tepidicella baoligensis]|uniref:cytochrome b/b6 domain-containing protein n=1 Tax=Tepidicella baoligensis TaxID=2707016 RepID=UPI001FE51461|nr:cytochrome b/b6 domain-containing protein [Tepidicella baoligensis]